MSHDNMQLVDLATVATCANESSDSCLKHLLLNND